MDKQIIRVAVITTSFPLREGAVSGVFIQRLVNNFPSFVRATVVTPSDVTPLPDDATDRYDLSCFRYAPWRWQMLAHQPGGIPVALKRYKLMRLVLPFFLTAMFFACYREAKKSDVIHANWSVNGAIAGIAGRLAGKPVVTTLRGEDVTRAESSRVYRLFLSLCFKTNDRLVAVSEAISTSLIQQFPAHKRKVFFLPNGVDARLLDIEHASRKPEGVFRLITVGSLIPRKGVDVIINALARLKDPSRFHLSIIGSGAELATLEALVRRESLMGCVAFIGEVAPEKVTRYLLKADAFVLASYSEGRPNVVLEAMAAGVPVVASDIDGVRELITDGDTGLRFPPGDATALAKRMKQLADNAELQTQFANEGRAFIVRNRLIWSDVGERYANIYNEVVCH